VGTIKYIFDHPTEVIERRKKARERCKSGYSWEIMEGELISIFEKYKTD